MSKPNDALESLPGIGPSLAKGLQDLGFREPSDLRSQDPEKMFDDLCEIRRQKIDRCVLYAFRCAVYAASTESPDPKLLKWWNWKDRTVWRTCSDGTLWRR